MGSAWFFGEGAGWGWVVVTGALALIPHAIHLNVGSMRGLVSI